MLDKVKNDVLTTSPFFSSRHQSCWSYDLKTGIYVHFRASQWSSQDRYQSSYLRDKPAFFEVLQDGEEGDDGKVYFYVTRSGIKEVFRFGVDPGTLLCPHNEFRRLYVLNLGKDSVRLRVVSFDQFSRYISSFLRNRGSILLN